MRREVEAIGLLPLFLFMAALCIFRMPSAESATQDKDDIQVFPQGRHAEASQAARALHALYVKLSHEAAEAKKLGQQERQMECREDELLIVEMWKLLQELHGDLPSLPSASSFEHQTQHYVQRQRQDEL